MKVNPVIIGVLVLKCQWQQQGMELGFACFTSGVGNRRHGGPDLARETILTGLPNGIFTVLNIFIYSSHCIFLACQTVYLQL